MKYLFGICVLLLFFTSCGTYKRVINANAIAEKMSVRKVARKHVAANFDKKTLAVKVKVKFDNGQNKRKCYCYPTACKRRSSFVKSVKIHYNFKSKNNANKRTILFSFFQKLL